MLCHEYVAKKTAFDSRYHGLHFHNIWLLTNRTGFSPGPQPAAYFNHHITKEISQFRFVVTMLEPNAQSSKIDVSPTYIRLQKSCRITVSQCTPLTSNWTVAQTVTDLLEKKTVRYSSAFANTARKTDKNHRKKWKKQRFAWGSNPRTTDVSTKTTPFSTRPRGL